jgi:tRNA (guanine26-N2/guanine27-N2)-dimethyltransferase
MRLVRTTEGGTELFVTRGSLEDPVPPTAPVFFNPAAATNRDISVAVTSAARGRTFCDALAGVGARGVRVANESTRRVDVTLVDFNWESLKVAKMSARANKVLGKCRFVKSEACSFLNSRYGRIEKYDFVDVDPFGTPVRFMQGALAAVSDGGIVSLTATDTAVLCGVHRDVCRRRYGAEPLNNYFHHETATRILLNSFRRQAASIDLGVEPVLAHSTKHYIRVYARVMAGPSKADASLRNERYIKWCPKCHHSEVSETPAETCATCGGKAKCAGPLWVGGLTDSPLVRRTLKEARRRRFREAERILASLGDVDRFPPWSFSIEQICSSLGVPSVPESEVAEALGSAGFACARQPLEKTGIKTKASYREVVNAVALVSGARKRSRWRPDACRRPRKERQEGYRSLAEPYLQGVAAIRLPF